MKTERCPICARPLPGQPLTGDERPCRVTSSHRCYEVGFMRVSVALAEACALNQRLRVELMGLRDSIDLPTRATGTESEASKDAC